MVVAWARERSRGIVRRGARGEGVVMRFAYPVEEPLARGSIKSADIARLSVAFAGDGAADREGAELLFALDEACPVRALTWTTFLTDTVARHLIELSEPRGYLTGDKADWLIDMVCRNGWIETRSGLDLVIEVMQRARWTPVSLVLCVLRQVHRAVAEGAGPLRAACGSPPGIIRDAEVGLLQRALAAFAREGSLALTREEAEILLEIADCVAGGPVNPRWQDFFAKAMTNAVLASSGYRAPPRDVALALAELEDGVGGQVAGQALLNLSSVLSAYREQSREEQALARLDRQRRALITAEALTEIEPCWLSVALDRDSLLSTGDLGFLKLLGATAVRVHPDLSGLIARAGSAA